MYIFQCYLKLERISDCLCGEGRGGELDPTLALSLLWRLPMSQMTQKGCSCLKHPGVRPALVAGGSTQTPLLLSSMCSHPPHIPARLVGSRRRPCPPGPWGREPGGQHTPSGSGLKSTQEPQALYWLLLMTCYLQKPLQVCTEKALDQLVFPESRVVSHKLHHVQGTQMPCREVVPWGWLQQLECSHCKEMVGSELGLAQGRHRESVLPWGEGRGTQARF